MIGFAPLCRWSFYLISCPTRWSWMWLLFGCLILSWSQHPCTTLCTGGRAKNVQQLKNSFGKSVFFGFLSGVCFLCFLLSFLWGVWCPAPFYHGQSRLIKLPISEFRIFYSNFTLERFEEFQNKISLLANKEQLSLRNSSILCWEIHVKHKFQCCKNTFGTVNSTTF